LKDDEGELYYFNSGTGVSQWEPPEWFEEKDPATETVFYVNTGTGEPQWDKPAGYVPVVRAEVYSTNMASHLKDVLSPKRSRMGADMFRDDDGVDV